MISAAFAGFAGVLFAYSEQYIAPNNFSFELSVQFLLAVTMGGRKSRLGPILGAAIIVYLPNLLADIDLFRNVAGGIAAVALVVAGVSDRARSPEQPAARRDPGRALRRLLRVLAAAAEDHRLQADGLRRDDPVRRLLSAGRHRRLPQAAAARRRAGLRLRADPRWPAATRRRRLSASRAPSVEAEAPLLDVRSVVMQFGGLKALDGVDLAVVPRHHPWADRPERLGQEHDDERADRHLRADRRRAFVSTAPTSPV